MQQENSPKEKYKKGNFSQLTQAIIFTFLQNTDRYCYVNKKDQPATIKKLTFISTTYVLCMIAERRQVFLSIAIQKVIHVSFGRQ